jgi:hypothetical protein
MKITGVLLLVSGWLLVLCAVAMLAGGSRNLFILAGLGVEILGLALAVRAHLQDRGPERGSARPGAGR